MNRSMVEFCMKDGTHTARSIVVHALWRRSRGRNPSEPYRGCLNPRQALRLAFTELGLTALPGLEFKELLHKEMEAARWAEFQKRFAIRVSVFVMS